MRNSLFVFSRGIVIRNYVHTGVLNALKIEHKKQINVASFDKELTKEFRNLNYYSFENLPRLVQFMYRVSKIWHFQVYPTQTSVLLDYKPLYSEKLSTSKRFINFFFPKSRKFFRLYKRFVCFLIVCNSRDLIAEVRDNGIEQLVSLVPTGSADVVYQCVFDYLDLKKVAIVKSFDNITTKGHFLVHFDDYLVWNIQMKRELISYLDISEHKIKVVGIPHINNAIKNSVVKTELFGNKKKTILFASVSEQLNRNEINIVKYLANNLNRLNMNLLVRIHQNDNLSRWSEIQDVEGVKISVQGKHSDTFENSEFRVANSSALNSLHNELMNTDFIISTASTILFEALLYPIIPICLTFDSVFEKQNSFSSVERFYFFEHYKEFTLSPSILKPRDISGLIEVLLNTEYSSVKESLGQLSVRVNPCLDKDYSAKLLGML